LQFASKEGNRRVWDLSGIFILHTFGHLNEK
jgi:hypothetical protein